MLSSSLPISPTGRTAVEDKTGAAGNVKITDWWPIFHTLPFRGLRWGRTLVHLFLLRHCLYLFLCATAIRLWDTLLDNMFFYYMKRAQFDSATHHTDATLMHWKCVKIVNRNIFSCLGNAFQKLSDHLLNLFSAWSNRLGAESHR